MLFLSKLGSGFLSISYSKWLENNTLCRFICHDSTRNVFHMKIKSRVLVSKSSLYWVERKIRSPVPGGSVHADLPRVGRWYECRTNPSIQSCLLLFEWLFCHIHDGSDHSFDRHIQSWVSSGIAHCLNEISWRREVFDRFNFLRSWRDGLGL